MPSRFPSFFAASLLLCSCGYLGVDWQEQDGPSTPPFGLGGVGAGGVLTGSTGGGQGGGDGGALIDGATGGSSGAGSGGADGSGGTGSGGTGSGGTDGSSGAGSGGADGSGGTGSGGEADTSAGGTPTKEPLFAEDFEGDIVGMATRAGGSTLELTDELSHSGGGSLVTTQGEPGVGASLQYNLTPRLEGDLYVRGWVYIPEGTVNGRVKLVGFENREVLFDVNVTGAGRVDIYVQDTDERSTSRPSAHPYDEWFCLQAHYRAHPTQGFVEAFINEESVARIAPQDTRRGNGVTAIDIGLIWTELDQTGGVTYWDDVAIDTEPVACAL